MKVLYMSHRFHNNQNDIMKGWLERGDEVCFLSQYSGELEDHTLVRPVVVGYSRIFLAFYKLYVNVLARKNPNALDIRLKVGFPPVKKLAGIIKSFHPDLVIMRERSVYTICMTAICRHYGYPNILYVMNPVWEENKRKDLAHRLVWKLVPKYRITPSIVAGTDYSGKVKDPNAFFAPYLMKPRISPEEKTYFKDNKIQILEVGKYQERKNHRLMLAAFLELNEKYPDTHLTIAGQVSDRFHEEYLSGLIKYVKENKLEDKVTLLKNQNKSQMLELYRHADLFVLPSTGEPGAVAHLEAMACSVPAICGDDNGTTCYIEPGKTGYVFEDNNQQDLTAKMEKAVKDPDKLMEMGRNAYNHVKEHFQFESYYRCIEEIMELQNKEKKKG